MNAPVPPPWLRSGWIDEDEGCVPMSPVEAIGIILGFVTAFLIFIGVIATILLSITGGIRS